MDDSKTRQDEVGHPLPQGVGRRTETTPEDVRGAAKTLAPSELAPHTPTLSEKQLAALKANAFRPGQTGNAGGRPKAEVSLKAMCRVATKEAVQKLVDLMRGAKDQKVQLRAAEVLLDRGYGKVAQAPAIPEQEGLPGDELTDEAMDKALDA